MLSPFIHQVSSLLSPFLNRRRGSVLVGSTSPLALFSGGAIGVWFDPSDVANLTWRRNLYTQTTNLTNTTSWPTGNVSLGTRNGASVNLSNVEGYAYIARPTGTDTFTSGVTYTFSVTAVCDQTIANVPIRFGGGFGVNAFALVNMVAGVPQRVTLTATATGSGTTASEFGIDARNGTVPGGSNATGYVVTFSDPQLELGTAATEYQRITDVNTEVIERFPTATMFKDASGTDPVTTPGDPVGLRLDKSKGLTLGPELVTNGNFIDPVTTGWTPLSGASLSVDNGRLKVTSTGGNPYAVYAVSTVANKWYSFTVSYDSGLHSGQLYIYPASNTAGLPLNTMSQSVLGSGIRTCYFMATGTTSYVLVQGLSVTSGVSVFFDNISVREVPGNHATQTTLASRPTYGIEPRGGRRNLLTYSEDFSQSVWVKLGTTASAHNIADPDGGTTASTITATTTGGYFYYNTSSNPTSGNTVVSLWIRRRTGTGDIRLRTNGGLGTDTPITVTSSWQRVSIICTAAALTTNCWVLNLATPGDAVDIWHPQLETSSTVTPYQKVTTEYDVTEAGIPTCHYVAYGGAHSMATRSIDFTATDKISAFAGVRKLSDVASGASATSIIVELGTGFMHLAGSTGYNTGQKYNFYSKGSVGANAITTNAAYTAPVSNVLTGLGDISGDSATLRIDGNQIAQITTDQGTGNYGNNVLFIGRRTNTEFPFNGRDYGIIVVGKTTSSTEITTTETWLAEKTGFFAPVITGVPTIGVS